MNNNKQTVKYSGLTLDVIAIVTFIVFLILKLTKVIDWSWAWVFSPLWIYAIIAGGFILIVLLLLGIAKLCERR